MRHTIRLAGAWPSVACVVFGGLTIGFLWGCGDSGGLTPTPVTPSSPALDGTWTGSAADASGPGQMTWRITQSGSAFSGTVTLVEGSTQVAGRGSVQGGQTGASISFSISIPAGGFDSPYETCSAEVSGSAQIVSLLITGSYTGRNSCSGEVASGQLALSKQ